VTVFRGDQTVGRRISERGRKTALTIPHDRRSVPPIEVRR
jgi:hypothetical protein